MTGKKWDVKVRADDTVEMIKIQWYKQVRQDCGKALDGQVSGSRVVLLDSEATDPTGKNGYLLDDSWRLAEVGCTEKSRSQITLVGTVQ